MIETKQAQPPVMMAIVSTNQLVRLGLQAVLKPHPYIRLIGDALSVYGAEEVIAREKPDILLVEMASTVDILEWVPKIKTSIPTIKIILLSGVEETRTTWQALSSGIDGIVLSIQPTAALLATIDYVCRKLAKTVLPGFEKRHRGGLPKETTPAIAVANPASPAGLAALTKREHEIIGLIAQGLSNKDIADRLHICCTTVRHHLTSIFDKLGVTSRQKLLIRAHQEGLVELKTLA
ncbi:MAG: putative Response regulator, LuxR family [Nitrospira sp.]|jgi:DNA-binding NarL/FixJ family response regulator|nr:putative Response regulator, LuxR family [Nitrospira sp.]